MGEKFYIFRFMVGTCLVLFAIFMFLIFICNILVYGIFDADLIGVLSSLIFIGLPFIIGYFIYPHEKDSILLGNHSDNDNQFDYKNPSSQHVNSPKSPTSTSSVKVKPIVKSNSQSNKIKRVNHNLETDAVRALRNKKVEDSSSGSATEKALRNRKAENNPDFMHKTISSRPKKSTSNSYVKEEPMVKSSYQSNTEQITSRVRNVSLSTRANVFERDNYTCQMCGRTISDGVKLEIDHIIPVSKGGSDNMSNLQTLCFDCNRGKSNKILHNQFNR